MRHLKSRRELLKSLGIAAGAAAAWPLFDAHADAGGGSGFPRRLLIVYHPHGCCRPNWHATGTETSFSLGRIHSVLEPFKSRLVVFKGIDNPAREGGVGHAHVMGASSLLTGVPSVEGGSKGHPGGMSVDQLVAQELGGATLYRSLQFGVRPGGFGISSAGKGQPLVPDADPKDVFERLFANLAEPEDGSGERRLAERKSVLDYVAGELSAVHARVSTHDRYKLDAHLTALRELERVLEAGPIAGCSIPAEPDDLDPTAHPNVPAVLTAQIDLLTTALACDMTRVATLQIGNQSGNFYNVWLGLDPDTTEHTYRHLGGNKPEHEGLNAIMDWYGEQFLYLLQRLDSIPEGGGSLLDNTLVVWCSAQGHGGDDNNLLFAGGAGGALKGGRFLEYSGASMNDVLVSICHLMGLEHVTSFGNPALCQGPLSGIV